MEHGQSVRFEYRVTRRLLPFTPVTYSDSTDGLITQAVVSEPLQAFGREVRLVISGKPEGERQASIVTTPIGAVQVVASDDKASKLHAPDEPSSK